MVEQFLKRFPEFADTDEQLVHLTLEEASSEVDHKTWGSKTKSGIFYLAAHKLACSPMGEPARLQGDENMTIYRYEYERMLKSLAFGFQVI